MRFTLGQINEVLLAADALRVLEIGNAEAFKARVAAMTPEQVFAVAQHITVLRRVAREWREVELPLPERPAGEIGP